MIGLTNSAVFARRASVVALLVVSTACSGAGSKTPLVEGVTVSPAREARQGQSDITLAYGHGAGGLSKPSRVDLQDLMVEVDHSSSDDNLVLHVTVPHGAMPGPRTLTLDTASGTTTLDDVLDITNITVAPSGDDKQLGTTHAPFRSLKQALAVAGEGDTCQLQAGTYDSTSGEVWGYAIPETLSIVGEPAGTSVLQGPGTATVVTSPDAVDPSAVSSGTTALEPAGAVTLQQVTLADFDVALNAAQPAQLSLENVSIRGNGMGVVVASAGSSLKLDGGSLQAGGYGVELAAGCSGCNLSVDGTMLSESGNVPVIEVLPAAQGSVISLSNADFAAGIVIEDASSKLTATNTTIEGNGEVAPLNFTGVELDITGSTLTAGMAPYAINLKSGTMSLDSDKLIGNQYSVYQLKGTSKVRGCELSGYQSIGFYYAQGDLDLGNASEPSNNKFVGATPDAHGLYVDTNTPPLSCSGTSFNGVVPPPGTIKAGTDLLAQPNEFVLAPGTSITFY
jgi:hypothetical protein